MVTAMLVSNSTDVFSGMLSLKVGENNQCDLFNIAFAFLSSSLDLALLSHLNDFPFSFFFPYVDLNIVLLTLKSIIR